MKSNLVKKLLVLATLGMTLVGGASAFADTTVDPVNGSTVDVVGDVQATTIVLTVPTTLNFAIDPNAANALTSVPASVVSATRAPIDLQILGAMADVGNSTAVVDQTKFTDAEWSALGVAATNQNIALGVKPSTGAVIWSPAEVGGTPPSAVSGIVRIEPLGTDTLTVDAKYGRSWPTAKTLTYKLYVRAALSTT